MATELSIAGSVRNLRMLLAQNQNQELEESEFCTTNNLENALSTLSEELESLGLESLTTSNNELHSIESLQTAFIKLVNMSWGLVNKQRTLMLSQSQLNDMHHKTSNDNANLMNRVKRLKEDLERKQHLLSESQERERRLRVQLDELSRNLKREKEETLKLRKQLQSKDSQHMHEMRRIQQNGHKLREQLQKSVGTYVPKDKAWQDMQAEHEKQVLLYQQTIRNLEENNQLMLQEANDLRDELSLYAEGIQLHVESSNIWKDEKLNI
ncbi:uncharacterized protein LOC107263732 [Cephus cinctus]|uniref:Uncharacterized protein LOC107263732 n=1 Tax=Cephus cinctus TaxID=211228 RepID=A0AAJ7R9H1_CEPCN|nr:uncharacterized protein LOC107263732 [Cephus cinctus]XP_024936820.1 uncharacterized protein LOC107263732 [Cephus cinctus]XP_024936821.1 uncharacterized protein LOC107263732 [Cephus cinctus]XP_024936822.1 uncharacterized protein LOC107263732 [Cephus cinctus]XP_024936823.1 uncharacterized protein LOC107263732 [Cephus cinctus]